MIDKGRREAGAGAQIGAARRVDLSHTIEEGLITVQGLPAPHVCDFLSYEQAKAHYGKDTSFLISKIEMVGNTGTYLDSPFHRFEKGHDLANLALERLVQLDAVVVRATGEQQRGIDRSAFLGIDVRGKAVLVHTGWAEHWGSKQYFDGHPFLTKAAAEYLRDEGALLVGIDSLNIDDTTDPLRPVHTTLLQAEIPIVEHLRGLHELPISGFTFSAVPPKIRSMASFPVRAFAVIAS